MNTTFVSTHNQNVTNAERLLRTIFGTALLTAISAGAVAFPVVIFTLSMLAVYLVMTAIIGSDPVYVAMKSFSKAINFKHDRLVTN